MMKGTARVAPQGADPEEISETSQGATKLTDSEWNNIWESTVDLHSRLFEDDLTLEPNDARRIASDLKTEDPNLSELDIANILMGVCAFEQGRDKLCVFHR